MKSNVDESDTGLLLKLVDKTRTDQLGLILFEKVSGWLFDMIVAVTSQKIFVLTRVPTVLPLLWLFLEGGAMLLDRGYPIKLEGAGSLEGRFNPFQFLHSNQ